MKNTRHFLLHLAQFFLKLEMFQTNIVKKIKTHSVFNNFFPKIVPFMRQCGKFYRAGQAKNDNLALTHCMLGY